MILRIFVGYDERERLAYHVLAHSIIRRASIPVSISPLNRKNISSIFSRPKGELDSTDFAISRFLVPYLCDYQGWAVFMDCDMLCLGDVAEFASYATLLDKYSIGIRVVKHQYEPTEETKFLGQAQTRYEKKNWSSVMLFNNNACLDLTPEYVNKTPGLSLHKFDWIDSRKIGSLPREWNYLVEEQNQTSNPPKLVHFTKGGPWFEEYAACEFAQEWREELKDMNG